MGLSNLSNRLLDALNEDEDEDEDEEAQPGEQAPQAGAADNAPRQGRRPPTPTLDRFGRDLTALAKDGALAPVVGRRREMRELERVLMKMGKNAAILVGEPGVGKTGVVEGLAQRLLASEAHPALAGKRIVDLSMTDLLAGAVYRGEFEERMRAVIREASTDDSVILFIDEIHTLVGAGGHSAGDAVNIVKPALARGEFRCIGATTTAEYRRYIEQDAALARRFQVVWVEEPTREEALEILRGVRPRLERHHRLKITDDALEAAVELSMRYLPDARLPDKAIDLLDQAGARGNISSAPVPPASRIDGEDVAIAVARLCRLPVEQLTEDEAERLEALDDFLGRRVVGQEEAVRAVADAVRRARVGLKDARRPAGAFLFVGATGTGKTELARALAEFLYHDPERLVRIDMSEFQQEHTVSRLIGAPPGYIGYEEEGQLTGALRRHPFSLVLLDEMEKAHPKVLDLLLQILDDGHLTDGHGRRVSFREAVVIATSNLGTGPAGPGAAFGFGRAGGRGHDDRERYRRQIHAALTQALRPELLGRLQIATFYPLPEAAMRRILDKMLDGLCERHGLRRRNIRLNLTKAAYAALVEAGYDPERGARAMEHAIEEQLVPLLAGALLAGDLREGIIAQVDADGGRLVLEPVGGRWGLDSLRGAGGA